MKRGRTVAAALERAVVFPNLPLTPKSIFQEHRGKAYTTIARPPIQKNQTEGRPSSAAPNPRLGVKVSPAQCEHPTNQPKTARKPSLPLLAASVWNVPVTLLNSRERRGKIETERRRQRPKTRPRNAKSTRKKHNMLTHIAHKHHQASPLPARTEPSCLVSSRR